GHTPAATAPPTERAAPAGEVAAAQLDARLRKILDPSDPFGDIGHIDAWSTHTSNLLTQAASRVKFTFSGPQNLPRMMLQSHFSPHSLPVTYVIRGCSDGVSKAETILKSATTMIEHDKFNRTVLDRNGVTMPRGSQDPRWRWFRDALSKRPGILVGAILSFLSLAGTMAEAQTPALPSLPRGTQGTPESSPGKGITAPTEDNPEATAAEATGPISVAETVSDDSVQRKLEKLLPKYPGVRKIGVEVEDGVVTLTGHVADNDVRDRLREFVRRVQGVNLVLNHTKTDVQVLTAREYALKQIRGYWDVISRKWLLCLFVVGLVLAASAVARLFNRYSETLLTLFTGNLLLRSVL